MTRETDEPNGAGDPDEDDRLREAVRTFLSDVDRAYGEYDQGYVDADATLRVLRSHVDELREELDE